MQLRHSTPVARKAHRCDWCYTTIQPGEKYHRSTNIYDDRIYDWIACAACDALCLDVWDWSYRPDEGVGEDSFMEWAREHADVDPRARDYLARRNHEAPAASAAGHEEDAHG